MPSHTTHITVAEKDGFDFETIEYYDRIIDMFHRKEARGKGITPGEAEALELKLLNPLINAVSIFPEADKPKEGLKAICHHYALDLLTRKGYESFLAIARTDGLGGVHSFLFAHENSAHIDRIARNRIPHAVTAREKNLLHISAKDMFEDLKNVIEKWHEVHQAENLDRAEELSRRFADVIRRVKGNFTGYSSTPAGYRAWKSDGHTGTFKEFMKEQRAFQRRNRK